MAHGQCSNGKSLVLSKVTDRSGNHASAFAFKLNYCIDFFLICFSSVYNFTQLVKKHRLFFFYNWNSERQSLISLIELASTLVFLVNWGVLNKTSKQSLLHPLLRQKLGAGSSFPIEWRCARGEVYGESVSGFPSSFRVVSHSPDSAGFWFPSEEIAPCAAVLQLVHGRRHFIEKYGKPFFWPRVGML